MALAPALADYLDCHAQALGHDGAQALAGGVIVPALLTSSLIIYVALIGYRLMLGQAFGERDVILSVARIALVITFCTRWPSYETAIYRVVTDGPNEVASAILKPSGLAVLTLSDTAERIQSVYDVLQNQRALAQSAAAKSASPDPRTLASIFPSNPASALPQQGGNGGAGVLFMASSLGGLLAVRLAGAVVLAVGPLIIALALFDSMLGLFEGWVRALVGVSLAAVGLMAVVAMELAFVEAELAGGGVDGAPPFTARGLMVVAVMFALVELGVLISAALIARGFKLPRWRPNRRPALSAIPNLTLMRNVAAQAPAVPPSLAPPSRAQAVADAVTAQGQRERALLGLGGMTVQGGASPSGPAPARRSAGDHLNAPQALGSSLRRSGASRRSPSTARRNAL